MKILKHLSHINLTPGQQKTALDLEYFINSDDHVFILEGYAGSGKTTILKGLINFLKDKKKATCVMAPTGRAAKILRDKTGLGQTIHKTIYNFEKLIQIQDEENKDDHSFRYMFPIRQNDHVDKILIVDEASMLSSMESKNELFHFGTDILLDDLLTYTGIPYARNKIIFVGDPAQLPPVGDKSSKALMPKYFETLGLKTRGSKLTEVVRQTENTILKNATKIRSLIHSDHKNELTLSFDDDCFIKTNSKDLASKYVQRFPLPEIGQGVIIAYSNAQCLEYNRSIRDRLFPDNPFVTSGDLLIISQNNYSSNEVELLNGEIVKVMKISPEVIERKNIPVYDTINGKKVKKNITLTFRSITIRTENHPNEITCLIIDSFLNGPDGSLSVLELKALYVDFVMRFEGNKKKNKQHKPEPSDVESQEFKDELKIDPYFNALRVKFGYAITCHKAQGGEWDTIFVDYYGRTGLKEDPLRWSYTATTRAVKSCYVANAPHVTLFTQFNIGDIQPLTNIPTSALALENIPVSPYHTENQHKAKSLKLWETQEKLSPTPFQISAVTSLGGFQERYQISYQEEINDFDAHHNGAGLFNDFQAVHHGQYAWNDEVLALLNQPHQITYNIDYVPTIPVLEQLYGLMQSICSEEEVIITNIDDKVKNFYTLYFLKTNAKCACIQFYFNGAGALTRALPKSTDNTADEKLKNIVTKLKKYVG